MGHMALPRAIIIRVVLVLALLLVGFPTIEYILQIEAGITERWRIGTYHLNIERVGLLVLGFILLATPYIYLNSIARISRVRRLPPGYYSCTIMTMIYPLLVYYYFGFSLMILLLSLIFTFVGVCVIHYCREITLETIFPFALSIAIPYGDMTMEGPISLVIITLFCVAVYIFWYFIIVSIDGIFEYLH